MTEYERLLQKAKKKGWMVPRTDHIDEGAWIRFWQQEEQRAQAIHNGESDPGRPIVPHRSGGGG